MARSAVTTVRDGTWNRLSLGRFGLLAALCAVGDAVTTAYILFTPGQTETNRTIDAMASIHPIVGAIGFGVFLGSTLAIALLSFGWLSDAAAGFLICSPGVSAVHNIVGFMTGMWMLRALPVPMYLTVGILMPILGFFLGVAVATRKAAVPWSEVTIGAAVVLGGGLAGLTV